MSTTTTSDPLVAWQRLRAGNERFFLPVRGHRQSPLDERPLAAVFRCADTGLASEMVFGQSWGSLIDVSTWGHAIDSGVLASLEYAVETLEVPLVVVLGHTSCGAIKGACDDVKLGNLTALLDKFKPAVAAASTPGEHNSHNHAFVDEVTELNVKQVVQKIRDQSPVLKALEDEGKIRIVGALYDTSSGKVSWY